MPFDNLVEEVDRIESVKLHAEECDRLHLRYAGPVTHVLGFTATSKYCGRVDREF